MVMQRMVPVYHLDAFKFLESSFINNEVFPLVRTGKNQGYKYKVGLKKPKKSLFWKETSKPKIEITATDECGIKKEKFSITIVCCWLENGEDEWVHYWLERLIRNDKDRWAERFDTPTSENDEKYKELYGLNKKKSYFFVWLNMLL